ncbi:MAG: SAM-dependent chlorinase/fluorinase [Planctomycetota bacterium]
MQATAGSSVASTGGHAIVTLTTDFGTGSRYVGEMKGAILAVNPAGTVIDLAHTVPPQDVATGSRWLAESTVSFPAGTIHVAVIDPGVGTDRDIVYAEFNEQRFVCPNNGLLTNLAERASPVTIIRIENPRYWRRAVSSTFHGRDIMGPVAGHLSRGLAPCELGTALTPGCIVRLEDNPPKPTTIDSRRDDPDETTTGGGVSQRIEGEVIEVDSFGNLITNIKSASLEGAPRDAALVVACEDHQTFGLQAAYADQPPMTLVALIGSGGRLELAIVDDSASAMLGVQVGAPVVVEW